MALRISRAHKLMLVELYERTRKTVDELPYSEEFERLYESFIQRTGLALNRHQTWRALSSCRKASLLSRKSKPKRRDERADT
jgi:aminoglycoside phosphotransferase (APT) family kinase protein